MRKNKNGVLVSESKIARSIRRGTFGVVNKHGTAGLVFAKMKQELMLNKMGKPWPAGSLKL